MKPVEYDIENKKDYPHSVIVGIATIELYTDVKKMLTELYKSGNIDNYIYTPIFEFDKNGDWQLRLKIERSFTLI